MYADRLAPRGAYLSFDALRAANTARLHVFPGHDADPWSANDWLTAVVGEIGEAANMLKKIRRGVVVRNKPIPSVDDVGEELADTIIYLDLLAARLNVDLAQAVINKFNLVSREIGAEQRL